MVRAIDLECYYRVPADVRDLDYAKYFSEGESRITEVQDYHSHNVPRLSVEEMVEVLSQLPELQAELASGPLTVIPEQRSLARRAA
jgi:UDP-glucose 4-epimerase